MKHDARESAGKPDEIQPSPGERPGFREVPYKRYRPARRLLSTEVVVLGLGAVSLVLLLLRGLFPPVLPSLAAFALFMVPGLVLSRLVLEDEDFPGAARLPVAFAVSTGVFGLPGIPMLVFHLSMVAYLLVCGVILAASFSLALYRLVRGEFYEPVLQEEDPASRWLWVPFLGLSGTLAYASTIRVEGPNEDGWIYLAYVRDYVDSASLRLNNPLFGGGATDAYMSFRTATNGWLLEQAALSRLSGTPPVNLVLDHLAPVLILGSLLAIYALSRTLLGRGAALLIGSLTALAFLIDLSATVQTSFLTPGHELVDRVTEDKYVTRFLFLPVSLGVAALYLRKRRPEYLYLFAFVCWSVAIVHPIGLMLVGISAAGLGFFHLLANLRNRRAWLDVIGLGAAVSSIAVLPAAYLLATDSPLLSRLSSGGALADSLIEAWVGYGRLMVLGDGSYIMHPAFLLNPGVLAAYVLGIPFLLFRSRKSLAARLLLGVLVFAALVIYIPPLSTLLAEIVGPWSLSRFSWPISLAAALVLGWMLWDILSFFRRRLEGSRFRTASYAGAFLPLLALAALVVGTAPLAVASVRSADESGELHRDEATCYDPTFRWLQDEIQEPATVLAPYEENSCIPAYSARADVVTLRGMSPRKRDQQALGFFGGISLSEQDVQTLLVHEVDYVLLSTNSPINAPLVYLPGVVELDNPGNRYRVYRVNRDELAATAAINANTPLLNGDRASASYYDTAPAGHANELSL